jgi:2-amino-4-hydroxy-6-hydroxymethyldihydropteridine diphosphokinase
MYSVYLLTGSNEGDRLQQLNLAAELLREKAGAVVAQSRIYETASWGLEDLPPHYNQALHLQTTLEPLGLLESIREIENKLGRVRQQKWGLRSIDIDIIYFENFVIQRPQLCIPHPLMQERRFVLAPLCEIAPKQMHPVLLKTTETLLETCSDRLQVRPIDGE